MNAANPSFIPRNHLVQKSLDLAVEGHYGELKQLLKAVSKPFNDKLGGKYTDAPGKMMLTRTLKHTAEHKNKLFRGQRKECRIF